MACKRHHIDEIADLAAAAVLTAIDDQAQVTLRKLALQSGHDGDRRIGRVADTEYYLKLRVGLIAERPQTFVRLRLRPAEGL